MRETVRQAAPRRELENVLRARDGDTKGREQFQHARELVAAWRASDATKRAAYLVLTEAINGVAWDSWNTYERRNDARDASEQVITALRVFERAYLDLKVVHGVDAFDRLLGRDWRRGLRVVDPVLKSLGQFQGHVNRVRAQLHRSERGPGRPPTRGRQKTATMALVGLGMSPREAEELIRSVGLTKQYGTRKTSRRH